MYVQWKPKHVSGSVAVKMVGTVTMLVPRHTPKSMIYTLMVVKRTTTKPSKFNF